MNLAFWNRNAGTGPGIKSLLDENSTEMLVTKTLDGSEMGRKVTPAEAHLHKELGIQLRLQQDISTLQAISDPVEFMKGREVHIQGIVKDAADHYRKVIKKYNDLGFPDSAANAIAMDSAEKYYNNELNILEYALPGAFNAAYSTANAKGIENRAKYTLATQANNDLVEEPRKARKSRKK